MVDFHGTLETGFRLSYYQNGLKRLCARQIVFARKAAEDLMLQLLDSESVICSSEEIFLKGIRGGTCDLNELALWLDRNYGVDQSEEVLHAKLDNMSTADMKEAVDVNAGRVILEASGNMTLDRIQEVA